MNENQHVGKVAFSHARARERKHLWPRPLARVYARAKHRNLCDYVFGSPVARVTRVSVRIRHDGILPRKTAETPPHKSAGPGVIYLFVKRNRTATVDGSYEAGSRILHTQTWKLLRKEARARAAR